MSLVSSALSARGVQTVAVAAKVPLASPTWVRFDPRRELLGRYSSEPRLLLLDRAGFLRRTLLVGKNQPLLTAIQDVTDPTPSFAVGQAAPDFALLDMRGELRRLSDLKGRKNLLLTFFPKCFTGGCANHLRSLRDEAAKLGEKNIQVWAVSIDAPDVQIAFAQSLGLSFPLLPDTERNVCLLYGATDNADSLARRMSVLIDKSGIVRWIDTDVHVGTHGADVLAKIQELGLNR